jgi:phytoene/squalene synthetase
MKPGPRMLLAVAVFALLWPNAQAFAQEDVDKNAKEEWQAQVDRARQRVEQIRREGKFVEKKEQSQQESARQMLARGLDDEDLRPGDIVSTENGFLRFEGISADNKRIFVRTVPGLKY